MPAAPLCSIIVPVYNEANTVRQVIERLLDISLPVAREVVVVDDGSTDGTRQVLDGLDGSVRELKVVYAPRNTGKGSAMRLGIQHATGSIIAIQDADLELDPAQLAGLIEPILRGQADVVYGSRFLAGRPAAPLLTIVANRVLTGVTNLLYGSSLTDMETCYKIMRADVANALQLESDRFDIEPEITAKVLRRGHRILELPVFFQPRPRSEGKKIRWWDGVRALIVLVKYRVGR